MNSEQLKINQKKKLPIHKNEWGVFYVDSFILNYQTMAFYTQCC